MNAMTVPVLVVEDSGVTVELAEVAELAAFEGLQQMPESVPKH